MGIVDCGIRRRNDAELGTASLVLIAESDRTSGRGARDDGKKLTRYAGDLTDAEFVTKVVRRFEPEPVIHLGDQRSAPYSMIDQEHSVRTQVNNLVGTLNLLWAIAQTDSSHRR